MSLMTKFLSLTVSALLVSACSSESAQKADKDNPQNRGGSPEQKGPSDLSCVPASGLAEISGTIAEDISLDLINGVLTTNFPAVVRITNSSSNTCTATAVSGTTLITAKHCLNTSEANGGVRFEYYTQAVAAISHPTLDLSVVVFPEGTFKTFAKLNDQNPRIGDALMLVGFGRTNPDDANSSDAKKRVGCNSILGFADHDMLLRTFTHKDGTGDYIHYRSPITASGVAGRDSMTAKGDSGGPVFIKGKLAAIISTGERRAKLQQMGYAIQNDPNVSNTEFYTYDVNLSGPNARAFLNRAKTEIKARINGL